LARSTYSHIHAGEAFVLDADSIIDADYVVVMPEPRMTDPKPSRSSKASHDDIVSTGMDMLRRTRFVTETRRSEPGGLLFWTCGIALAAAAFWISGGHALATSYLNAEAAPVRIATLNSHIEDSGRRPMLLVDGEVVNVSTGNATVPPLEIQVTSGNGRLTSYKLGTAGSLLPSGGIFPFSGRLDLPNDGVKSVTVNFVE
jgi:hypothetical protein